MTERLGLDSIPGLPKLYRDYILGFDALRDLYVLDYRSTGKLGTAPLRVGRMALDRGSLQKILLGQSRNWRDDPSVRESIRELGAGAHAVVTGQQIGLFCGPMYTIYKAATAVALAQALSGEGRDRYVPVFWMECEDHDILEVGHARILDRDHRLLKLAAYDTPARRPTGTYVVDGRVLGVLEKIASVCGGSASGERSLDILRESYEPGASLSSSFARTVSALFEGRGLVIIDPTDAELKRASSAMFSRIISGWEDMVTSLIESSERLRKRGYEPQIEAKRDRLPLYLMKNGERIQLSWKEGLFHSEEGEGFDLAALESIARDAPERYSPNVYSRPLLESYMLGTRIYVAGPGEISYFAQMGDLYPLVGLEMPAVFPRAQFTITLPAVRRILEKLDMSVSDFTGTEKDLLDRFSPGRGSPSALDTMGEARERLDKLHAWLADELVREEPEIRGPVETFKKKTAYQLRRLEERLRALSSRRDEALVRQIETARNHLFPLGRPQERVINTAYYLVNSGPGIAETLVSNMDVFDFSHRIVNL